uniref:Transcription factor TFIIIC triple barrel domain-containing protein n=1 Tax=Peronospora matthiolae TaxID=2874970 RepID=A0AAV1TU14_9STRA
MVMMMTIEEEEQPVVENGRDQEEVMMMTIEEEEEQLVAENGQEETKSNGVQQVHVDVQAEEQVDGDKRAGRKEDESAAGRGDEKGVIESECEEEEEEETLVVLELCDFKNHPLFEDYSSATLEGIDTATPMLRIGEYTLHGKLEETVGTSYFYDTDTTRAADKTYQFAGQTIKKMKFTIAPPEEF